MSDELERKCEEFLKTISMTNDEMVEKARAAICGDGNCVHGEEAWYCDCCQYEWEKALPQKVAAFARSAVRDAARECIRIADDEDYGCIGAEIAAALRKKFEVEG